MMNFNEENEEDCQDFQEISPNAIIFNEQKNSQDFQLIGITTLQQVEDFVVCSQDPIYTFNETKLNIQDPYQTCSKTILRKNQFINKVPINQSLQTHYLKQSELLKVMQFLSTKNIYLQEYLAYGGEADIYLGYQIDSNGNKQERVFRIVQAEVKNKIEIRQEYERVVSIKDSKNIIEYYGLIEVDDIFIFIMKKYVCSLKDRMKSKINYFSFWKIVFNLIDGLIELRMNNIIHSDIKPANILMNKDGTCVYSDFGMCLKLKVRQQIIDEKKGYSLRYCSPEHINKQSLSYASDVYSFGILVLELSEQLENKEVQEYLKKFIEDNLLSQDSTQRIKLENLIPSLIMKKELNIPLDNLQICLIQSYFNKSLRINQYFINRLMKFSYEIVNIMQFYIRIGKQELLSFNSVNDFSFELIEEETLVYYLLNLTDDYLEAKNYEQQLKYLEQCIKLIKSLPLYENKQKATQICEFRLGELYYQMRKLEQSIEHFQINLKILQTHFPNKYQSIAHSILSIGKCQLELSMFNECSQTFANSIEFIKQAKDNDSLIICYSHLGNCYEQWKGLESGLEYYQEVVKIWNQYEKSLGKNMCRFASSSFQQVGEYLKSYEIWIEFCRKNIYQDEDISDRYSFFCAPEGNISKFNSDERKYLLNKIICDQNNDLVKKTVLLDFISCFLKKRDYEQMIFVLNAYYGINEEMPLYQELRLKIILIKYFRNTKNQDEKSKTLKEALNLVTNSNESLNFNLLSFKLDLCCHLIQDDEMMEIGFTLLEITEEELNTFQDSPSRKDYLLRRLGNKKIKVFPQVAKKFGIECE